MGSACVPSLTICLMYLFKKDNYLIHCSKGLETRVLPWQHLNGCHFVPYLIYITGAKFEYHHSNVFGDILNLVIHYSHLQCF